MKGAFRDAVLRLTPGIDLSSAEKEFPGIGLRFGRGIGTLSILLLSIVVPRYYCNVQIRLLVPL